MAETADLKSLARRVLQRDSARDSERDSGRDRCLAAETVRQHIGGVSLARSPRGGTTRQPFQGPFSQTIAALEGRCPDQIDTAEWQRAVEDGRRFLAQCGDQAEALGWTARDLFGLHIPPARPGAELSEAVPIRR